MNKNKFTFFSKIIFLFIFGWILSFCGIVLPKIDITIQNNVEDILTNKKIKLSIDSAHTSAIFKDNISFSIENPFINIESIKITKEPRIEYIPSFRKNKKLYFGEFEVELKLAFLKNERDLIKKGLYESNLCFSFFMISKNGKTTSENLFVKLNTVFEEQKEEKEIEKKNEKNDLVVQKQNLQAFITKKTAKNFNLKTLSGFDLQNVSQYILILLISVFFILGFYFLLPFSNQKSSLFYICVAIFFISIAFCLSAKFYLMKAMWLGFIVLFAPLIML